MTETMACGYSVLFLVLTGALFVATERDVLNNAPQAKKDGACPVVHGRGKFCTHSCRFDSNCPGTEKCCPTGCGHDCLPAKGLTDKIHVAKEGSCPVVDGNGKSCVNMCAYDDECQGSQKCCSNGCGNSCFDPVGIKRTPSLAVQKAGTCPVVQGGAGGICPHGCSSDSDCDGLLKCCSNGCGTSCQFPEGIKRTPSLAVQKAGTCPVVQGGAGGICLHGCSSDSDCDGLLKCCSNGCGTSCQFPEASHGNLAVQKAGTCPAVKGAAGGICLHGCKSDNDCNIFLKCCSTGCGTSCQIPEGQKEGRCPAVEPSMGGICLQECQSDFACPGSQKCCSTGCGHACRGAGGR